SKLKKIGCSNNSLSSDLNPFSNLVDLEVLNLKKNNFSGSLEPLRNLTKLEYLDISNTSINNGVKYLPNNIRKIEYFNKKSTGELNNELKKIAWHLDLFNSKKQKY